MTSTSGSELTVASVCEAIWDVERELDLLSWRVGEVYAWPIVRMRVFHELTRRSGLLGDPHPVRRSTPDRIRLVGRHLVALVRQNPFLRRRLYDAVVIPHHRRVDGVDVYSEQVRRELGTAALVLDTNSKGGRSLPASCTLDFFVSAAGVVGRVRQRSRPGSGLPDDARQRVREIVDALAERTGVRLPLLGLVGAEVSKHRVLRRIHRDLLRRRGVGTVYVVVAYFHQHVVAAARDLGIRVVELQHGTITPYHLGYSYPGRPEVADQPDELWCFGPFWAETVDLPARTTTRVVGAPFVHRPQDLSGKDPALVVFVSQGTIGQRLLPVATRLAGLRPDLTVVFRLHPSEIRDDYTAPAGGGPANLRLSGGRPADPAGAEPAESTYELMTAATYLVGVSTTALFEGMALGCRTVVVDLAGAEYLTAAVTRGDALLVRDADELVRRLADAPRCTDAGAYYAPPLPRLLPG